MIVIEIERCLLRQRRGGVWRSWPIGVSRFGVGNLRGSLQTPLGRHRICAKIGEGMHPLTVFRARRPIGLLPPDPDPEADWIVGRILWLEGTETGRNRRGPVDTRRRYIYIHGTPFPDAIGRPSSIGCIRMRIDDLLALFDRSFVGERVYLRR